MKEFLVLDFTISPVDEGRDILLALLDDLGYDSFEETRNGLKAYIREDDFDESSLKELFLFSSNAFEISYTTDRLENKNWNEEWETNYEPIEIDDKVHIRAPFHAEKKDFEREILIVPKMSFGTGHHQTTRLMVRLMLPLNLKGKTVLDMGTGTGILAILAEMMDAKKVTAIDNFNWAVENTAENAEANNCSRIEAIHGDAEVLKGMKFDTVIANINRNVLLEDMKAYVDTFNENGQLLLSGFFEQDFELIDRQATNLGLKLVNKIQEDRWTACLYER